LEDKIYYDNRVADTDNTMSVCQVDEVAKSGNIHSTAGMR